MPSTGFSQAAKAESKPTPPDTLKSSALQAIAKENRKPTSGRRNAPDSSFAGKEMELEAISIAAIIEKPNVDIIPKRVPPVWEEIEFVDRSFDPELKALPKDLLLLDDDLDRVARLDGLKKLLEKKKKK